MAAFVFLECFLKIKKISFSTRHPPSSIHNLPLSPSTTFIIPHYHHLHHLPLPPPLSSPITTTSIIPHYHHHHYHDDVNKLDTHLNSTTTSNETTTIKKKSNSYPRKVDGVDGDVDYSPTLNPFYFILSYLHAFL